MSDLVHDLVPIQQALDVPGLFAGIARSIVDAIKCDACLVSVLDGDGATLRDIGAAVVPPARLHMLAAERRLVDNPVNREVMEARTSAELSALAPDARARHVQILGDMGFARVLICPLVIEDKAIGTIEAFRLDDRPFRVDDPDEISIIGAFASSSYERLQLAVKLEQQYTVTLEALASVLEAKDPYTRAHTGRIRDMASGLAVAMQVPADELRAIKLGAILHDVGKIGIADSLLHKKSELTEEQWIIMRTHPELGVRILKNIEFLNDALPIIRHHHERWDGNGYPEGLAGDNIPLGARIVTVCDAFDAMTTDRPYRSAIPIEKACTEVMTCAGKQFDPTCAGMLVETIQSVGHEHLERRFVRYAS